MAEKKGALARILSMLFGIIVMFYIFCPAQFFAHELGHYLAAQIFGVPVTQFGIGFGPKVLAIDLFGTEWSLRLLALGGFNAFDPTAWSELSWLGYTTIAVAGPLGNFLFSWMVIAWLLKRGGHMNMTELKKFPGMLRPKNAFLFTKDDRITGLARMIHLICFLGFLLGVANLMPVPPLDGGIILLASIEALGFVKASEWVQANQWYFFIPAVIWLNWYISRLSNRRKEAEAKKKAELAAIVEEAEKLAEMSTNKTSGGVSGSIIAGKGNVFLPAVVVVNRVLGGVYKLKDNNDGTSSLALGDAPFIRVLGALFAAIKSS